jgi:hypothetical protein
VSVVEPHRFRGRHEVDEVDLGHRRHEPLANCELPVEGAEDRGWPTTRAGAA